MIRDARLPALIARLAAPLLRAQDILRQRRRLAELDATALRDLGLSRDDVSAELARPFWMIPGFTAGGDENLSLRRHLPRHG